MTLYVFECIFIHSDIAGVPSPQIAIHLAVLVAALEQRPSKEKLSCNTSRGPHVDCLVERQPCTE